MEKTAPSPAAEARIARVAPVIRGLLARPSGNDDVPYKRVILEFLSGKEIPPAPAVGERGAAQLPPLPLASLDYEAAPERLREQIASAISDFAQRHGAKPQVIVLPGVGALCAVEDAAEPDLPLRNETAIVTGAAGAIGSGICRGLLKNGCRVAATDLPGERLERFVAEFARTAGHRPFDGTQGGPEQRRTGRIIGVPLDVTSEKSVADAFNAVARRWGGVDIVIANAGIPLISSLVEMSLEDFRRLEQVNVEGTLLTLAEAGRHMRLQGTGGDIVLISTKNVFSPGARFGGYSATKAGAHQLARIASLEMAPFGVRVNMVAPDAVFADGERKSGLWEKIGPDRMRDKGIDEKGLQDYYRQRNLLKVQVTAEHVANAVLFFVTRQTPTTGATIPVDGGLPDATPR